MRAEVPDLAGEEGLISLDERISVITGGRMIAVILGEEILWGYKWERGLPSSGGLRQGQPQNQWGKGSVGSWGPRPSDDDRAVLRSRRSLGISQCCWM